MCGGSVANPASAVFLAAALHVAEKNFIPPGFTTAGEHRCCCGAIEDEGGGSRALNLFSSIFKPESKNYSPYWFGDPSREKNRGPRVIALLLAAEVAKDMESNHD